jgi:phosphoribosylamine--glycine ligase
VGWSGLLVVYCGVATAMNILIVDTFGDMLDLALRAKEVGHNITYYIDQTNPKYKLVGKGLLPRTSCIPDNSAAMRIDMIILADNIKYLDFFERFKKDNPKAIIFGTNKQVARWEHDRMEGMEVLRRHGIECPPTRLCSGHDEAVAYVKKRDTRLVCKPCGDAPKELSYVSRTPEDLIFMLDKWEKEGKLKDKFVLQDFIEGVEFAVGSYVGRDGFEGGFEENFEFKKLMAGDKGPSTGEMGTVMMITSHSKLASKVLKPLEQTLVYAGYNGDIDVNCIIDGFGKAWPLEFTSRFGYPALQIQTPLFPEDPVQWMYDLVKYGTTPKFVKDTISLGVALCMYPFPYESAPADMAQGSPIIGIEEVNTDHLHPYHMMSGKNTLWETAGQYAMVVTGTGQAVHRVNKKVLETIKSLIIPGDVLYRVDIGDKLKEALPKIQSHGFASKFVY